MAATKKKTGTKRGAKLKFPNPGKVPLGDPFALCSAERVKALYNQAHPAKEASKIAGKVQEWFENQAAKKGWTHTKWIRDISNNWGAGCILGVRIEAVQLLVLRKETVVHVHHTE